MEPKHRYAVIVAGGSGRRMGGETPKQFIEVAGKPILMHTIQKFYGAVPLIKIILVLPESQQGVWSGLVDKYRFTIPHKVVKGGVERFFSVLNGLKHVTQNSIVAVHDGVRPLVSAKTISACFGTAAKTGSAIPVVPATESIRKVRGNGSMAVNREYYVMVQTPQVFQSEILVDAYMQEYDCAFTDDASVVEKNGDEVALVQGNPENIKITRPMDLEIARALLILP